MPGICYNDLYESQNMGDFPFDVCVVGGAGHIGLPFALVFAEAGSQVSIYDRNVDALEQIGRGKVPFLEQGAPEILSAALSRRTLTLSPKPEVVAESHAIVVTIGTPIDEFLNPVFRDIADCLEELSPFLRHGQILILRSTVFPGTTQWCADWLRAKKLDILLAYCPERVVQGKAIEEIRRLPQIVGGTTRQSEEAVIGFFRKIGVETCPLSPLEAEFAKLFSNAYRYIHFAIANQFYMITESAGVDYDRVLRGVKFHYPRLEGLPGAGFAAGPCLLKDTLQLNAFAKNQFFLGQAAMNVNEGLVNFVVDRMALKWNLSEMTIGILGMAFKPDNDDIRASLSYKLRKMLAFKARKVLITDPYVQNDSRILPLEEVVRKSDVLVLAVPHREYHDLSVGGKPVVDIWGYLGAGSSIYAAH
jgi:UDP-N-acetyl-D-mannosaminuronic acid dehydrogenase